jgi:hypothetical protein
MYPGMEFGNGDEERDTFTPPISSPVTNSTQSVGVTFDGPIATI